jgi:hypothetical protein
VRAIKSKTKGDGGMVRLKATELDVYVDGNPVGTVYDCGGFWRIGVRGRRKRRAYNLDLDTRAKAVSAVVAIVTGP